MNYRHIYHAGNFADVLKHIILVAITKSFLRKDKGFCYLDTHAGIGQYALNSPEAQKSKEFENGIAKIFLQKNRPPLVEDYLQSVHEKIYPGSPLIVKHYLRPQDRMILSELHPEDYAVLKNLFIRDKQVAVHLQDGYQSLKAHLPPKERRGLILIDPPYEKADEFSHLLTAIPETLQRFETGCYVLWYPIKNYSAITRFKNSFKEKIHRPILNCELSIYAENTEISLNGCGMLIINPPWQLKEELQQVIPWLWQTLSINHQGQYFADFIQS